MIKDIQISVKDDIRFRSVRFMIYWTSTLEQLGERSFCASPKNGEDLLEKLVKHQELEKNHQVLENHQIFAEEGMVMFQLQGHDAVLWEVDDNMLGLIVIDDNSGSVVCEKRYRYEDVMLVANFKMTK